MVNMTSSDTKKTKNNVCDNCGIEAPIFGTSMPRLCTNCLPDFKNFIPGKNPFLKVDKKKK